MEPSRLCLLSSAAVAASRMVAIADSSVLLATPIANRTSAGCSPIRNGLASSVRQRFTAACTSLDAHVRSKPTMKLLWLSRATSGEYAEFGHGEEHDSRRITSKASSVCDAVAVAVEATER